MLPVGMAVVVMVSDKVFVKVPCGVVTVGTAPLVTAVAPTISPPTAGADDVAAVTGSDVMMCCM